MKLLIILSFIINTISAQAVVAEHNRGKIVANNCIRGYCVNDIAVARNTLGTIIAVHPTTNEITIRFNSSDPESRPSSYVKTFSIDQVAVGKGCVGGFCLDQTVVAGNKKGTVIAVNPENGQVAIRLYNSMQILTFPISQISSNK